MSDVNNWRWYVFAIAVPAGFLPLLRWNTPESPKFLASKGRLDEALEILKRVAKENGDPEKLARIEGTVLCMEPKQSQDSDEKVCSLKRFPVNLLVWTLWILVTFSTEFGNWLPQALTQLPAYDTPSGKQVRSAWLFVFNTNELVAPLIVAAACKIGPCGTGARIALSALGACLALVAHSLVLMNSVSMTTVCLTAFPCGYLAIFNWVLMYAWTPEVYPTDIRTSAFGLAMGINRVGQALGPVFFSQLEAKAIYLPPLASAASAALMAFVAGPICSLVIRS
jgi:MFS family permease